VGKLERKRPLGIHRRRWDDNVKMDLRGMGWIAMDWIDLAQDRDQRRALVNSLAHFPEEKNIEYCRELSCEVNLGWNRLHERCDLLFRQSPHSHRAHFHIPNLHFYVSLVSENFL
jgi:hypothetical protein